MGYCCETAKHMATADTMWMAMCVCVSPDMLSLFDKLSAAVAIIMDGASTNLAMIKDLSGHGKGSYGIN